MVRRYSIRLAGPNNRIQPAVSRRGRRSFSWRTKWLRASHHPSSIYQSSISYVIPSSTSYSKVLYRNYFWKRGHFLNQYTQSPEWRLLSSWGRRLDGAQGQGNNRCQRERERQENQEDDWYDAWQSRNRATIRRLDEFKKLVDEDPYRALFGRTLPESWFKPEKETRGKQSKEDQPRPSTSTNENTVSSTNGLPFRPSQDADFVFDPITMRRIPRANLKAEDTSSTPSGAPSEPFSIPVKTFKKASREIKGVNGPKSGIFETGEAQEGKQIFSTKEGFDKSREHEGLPRSKEASSPKIESALDRYQRKLKPVAERHKDTAPLTYNLEEIRTDDVDLLTASDIRASAGRVGRRTQESLKEKEDRRQTLEKKYDERSVGLEKQLANELAAKAEREKNLQRELEEIAKEQKKRDFTMKAHEDEIKTQKAAMEAHETRRTSVQETPTSLQTDHPPQGEGDVASNVHNFSTRDRWYKRKAPHANTEADQKLLQATKDKALVREIRGIYEDTYGTIGTKHRQLPSQASTEVSEYPSDAYPGTLYEQPRTANVPSDHPDVDVRGTIPTFEQKLQSHFEKQKFETLSLIGKLFSEMRENQNLLQENRTQLQALTAKDSSQNLFQNLKAREQRIMQTLKEAQNLVKSTTTFGAIKNDSSDASNLPFAPANPIAKSEESLSEKENSASPALYKILAYDPSTQRVTVSRTTSLVGPVTGKPLTFSEALFGLENPAKFLSHLTSLQHGDYEIAAGGPNLLIFKKIRQLKPSQEEEAPEDPAWHANPIDGMVAPTGNFASPTGFVNYDPPLLEPEPQNAPKAAVEAVKGNGKVRRQEAVFSGSSRRAWHDQYDRGSSGRSKSKGKHRKAAKRGGTARRMLLVGLLTATGCYAVGVASEFFRI